MTTPKYRTDTTGVLVARAFGTAGPAVISALTREAVALVLAQDAVNVTLVHTPGR